MALRRACSYCVLWRRVGTRSGDDDTFRHQVQAQGPQEARNRSQALIARALGSNSRLWTVESALPSPSCSIGLWEHIRQIVARLAWHRAPKSSAQLRAGRFS